MSLIYLKYKNDFLRACAFMLLLLFHETSYAQEVKLNTKAQPTSISLGDPIVLSYQLSFDPQKYRVTLPKLADTFNRFETIGKSTIDTQDQRNQVIVTQQNRLTHFDSGVHVIPSFAFVVQPLDGTPSYEIKSDSVLIQVNTVEVDTSKPIKPIFDIIAAEQPWWRLPLIILLSLLGIGLVAFLIYYFLKRKKNQVKQPIETKKQLTPYEAALLELERIKKEEAWLKGEEKRYHTELTDTVRTYLEQELELDCFEKTSPEILRDVKKYLQKGLYKNRSEDLDKLRDIFNRADLVKFAKSKPSEEEHVQSLVDAKSFLDRVNKFVKISKQVELNSKTQTP